MTRLEEFLKNHKKKSFNDLLNRELGEITGLKYYSTVKELMTDFDIWIYTFDYKTNILRLVEYDNEVKKFKWLSTYIIFGSILFMLIFPIIVSNYWLYLFILLVPLSIFASGLIKNPIQTLFLLIVIGLILYSIFAGVYINIAMVIPAIIILIGSKKAKLFYRHSLIKSAIRNELNFKFLWFIGIIQVRDKLTDEIFSYSKILKNESSTT